MIINRIKYVSDSSLIEVLASLKLSQVVNKLLNLQDDQ